ncbi:hypothetical protein AAFF_G00092270 [Aldrovandia affinis]|uniref:Uncharacterized protein n=1 Tax=Aldrovandia affinis TaxID=143900 RepID=A0AAD7WXG6_9TELE|nr:hypothetical protein AAFF_G00092270 [Aldrovandia affinis]
METLCLGLPCGACARGGAEEQGDRTCEGHHQRPALSVALQSPPPSSPLTTCHLSEAIRRPSLWNNVFDLALGCSRCLKLCPGPLLAGSFDLLSNSAPATAALGFSSANFAGPLTS